MDGEKQNGILGELNHIYTPATLITVQTTQLLPAGNSVSDEPNNRPSVYFVSRTHSTPFWFIALQWFLSNDSWKRDDEISNG